MSSQVRDDSPGTAKRWDEHAGYFTADIERWTAERRERSIDAGCRWIDDRSCFGDDVAGGVPVDDVGWARWAGSDQRPAVGDVVFEAILLDLDDGSDPGAVLRTLGGPRPDRLGDIARRVLNDSGRLPADAFAEDVANRVDLDLVGSVCGEVAGTPVLARVERGDLAVESIGLLLEVREIVLAGEQVDVRETSFLPWALPAFQLGDGQP